MPGFDELESILHNDDPVITEDTPVTEQPKVDFNIGDIWKESSRNIRFHFNTFSKFDLQNSEWERTADLYKQLIGESLLTEEDVKAIQDIELKRDTLSTTSAWLQKPYGNLSRDAMQEFINRSDVRISQKKELFPQLLFNDQRNERSSIKSDISDVELLEVLGSDMNVLEKGTGLIGGSITGSLHDPIQLLGLGLGAQVTLGRNASILKNALVSAGINVAAQIPTEVAAFDTANFLDNEYGFKDSGLNLALNAGLGATVPLVTQGGPLLMSESLARISHSKKVPAGIRVLASKTAEALHMKETNPFGGIKSSSQLTHARLLAKSMNALEQGLGVTDDLLPITNEGLERLAKNTDPKTLEPMTKRNISKSKPAKGSSAFKGQVEGFKRDRVLTPNELDDNFATALLPKKKTGEQPSQIVVLKGGVYRNTTLQNQETITALLRAGVSPDDFEFETVKVGRKKVRRIVNDALREAGQYSDFQLQRGEDIDFDVLQEILGPNLSNVRRTAATPANIQEAISSLEQLRTISTQEVGDEITNDIAHLKSSPDITTPELKNVLDKNNIRLGRPVTGVADKIDPKKVTPSDNSSIEFEAAYRDMLSESGESEVDTMFSNLLDEDKDFRLVKADGTEVTVSELANELAEEDKIMKTISGCGKSGDFSKCLQEKMNKGLLNKNAGEKVLRQFGSLKAKYTQSMSDTMAANEAAKDLTIQRTAITRRKKANLQRAAIDQKNILNQILEGKENIDDVVFIIEELYNEAGRFQKVVFNQLIRNVRDWAEEFNVKGLGLVQKYEGMHPVIRELYGESTGDPIASQYAKQLRKSLDISLLRLRAAGSEIGEVPNFVPQNVHNPRKIASVSFQEWRDSFINSLDRERMTDWDTGLPFTDERLNELMRADYEAMRTRGASDRIDFDSMPASRKGDIDARRQGHRFYVFKTADGFLDYNRQFGVGDEGLPNLFFEYFFSVSRDIATMEKLGTKPRAMNQFLKKQALKLGKPFLKTIPLDNRVQFMDRMFSTLVGDMSSQGESWFSNVVRGLMNASSGIFLAGAGAAALGDMPLVTAAAHMSGLPAWGTFRKYVRNVAVPMKTKEREFVSGAMMLTDSLMLNMSSSLRFTGDLGSDGGLNLFSTMRNKPGATRTFRDSMGVFSRFINRASLLNHMTQAPKDALSGALGIELGTNLGKKFSQLKPDLQKALKSAGIGAQGWADLSKAKPTIIKNSKMLTHQDILNIKDLSPARRFELMNLVDEWHVNLRDLGLNEPNIRTRAVQNFAGTPDDLGSLLVTSTMQFLSFPITFGNNWVLPHLVKNTSAGQKIGALTTLFTGMTLMGAAVTQLKNIAEGRSLADPRNPKFWKRAMMQGGGLGLLTDFLFGPGDKPVGGPIAELISRGTDVFKLNIIRAFEGEDTKFLEDSFEFITYLLPPKRLIYTRAPYSNVVVPFFRDLAGFDNDRLQRREQIRRDEEDIGPGWWGVGEPLPSFLE